MQVRRIAYGKDRQKTVSVQFTACIEVVVVVEVEVVLVLAVVVQ